MKRVNFMTHVKRTLAVLLCAVLVLTAFPLPAKAEPTEVSIHGTMIKSARLRKGPSAEYALIVTLSKGDKVEIYAKAYGSYQVSAEHNGKTYSGYVAADAVESEEVPDGMEATELPMPDQTGNPLVGKKVYALRAVWLRASATTASERISSLRAGDRCTILASGLGWYQVKLVRNGKTIKGFVYNTYVSEPKKSNEVVYGYVNYDYLNVREKATVLSKKIGELYKSQRVSILSSDSGWYKISYQSGNMARTGYVKANYLNLTGKGKLNRNTSLYSKRNLSSKKLATVKKGTKVTVLSETKGWLKVTYTRSGKTYKGYVKAAYVDM